MANMTLSIPESLFAKMKAMKEMRWSEIARQALWDHARKLELMDKLLTKSKLTEQDAEQIGNKIKHGIARRHGLVK